MKIKPNQLLSIIFSILFIFITSAQEIKKDSVLHTANIIETIYNNQVVFKAELSPLRQIAGAPKAFWANYWEFDDGNYSFKENPKHTYKEEGEYIVRLAATNNYDDGEPPLTRPKKIQINNANDESSINEEHHLIENHNGLRLQNNREPRPNEEMQVILSYGNEKEYPTNGKLYVFFNEKKYKNDNFILTDVRSYHNEEETNEEFISSINNIKYKNELIKTTGINTFVTDKFLQDTTRLDLTNSLDAAKLFYRDYKVWNVDNVQPKEERNLFLTLKTTPEMLKDTSAIITIRSIYVPERGKNLHKITEKEMEIVTSHDPNKMAVYQSFLNYRLVRFKRLKYKVRFQNNGEGPASLIKLNVDIPEMLDKSSLKVIDMYPKVPICPLGKKVRYSCMDTIIMKDKISFQFKNIYLPGTNQKGVMEKDSTKGFVKYSMKFAKDFHKVKSVSKTEIIFDKNDPILTNSSTSRFTPGLSIGVKAGYNHFFTSDENLDFNELNNDIKMDTKAKGYFLGATISPYKSYKWYLQAEIMAGMQLIESNGLDEIIEGDAATFERITRTNLLTETTKEYIDIIPISVRYNFNAILAAGGGIQTSFNFYQKSTSTLDQKVFFVNQNSGGLEEEITDLRKNELTENTNTSLNLNNYGLFLDFTVGVSRIGPSIGIRYIQNFNKPTSQIHTYAIWKF
jgi:hypothetical protein